MSAPPLQQRDGLIDCWQCVSPLQQLKGYSYKMSYAYIMTSLVKQVLMLRMRPKLVRLQSACVDRNWHHMLHSNSIFT